MKQIKIEDVKAIVNLTLPIPEGGGVVVLQGANGCGKSTALDAIATAAGARDRGLTARDGAKFGKVTAPGITLRVAKSTTRAGELELQSIEGKHSIDKLVDPGFVDPAASDRARIRTLIQFAGVDPDIGIFSGIEGYDLARDRVVESEDVLKVAASLKEEIEKLARSSENSAAEAAAKASLLYEQSAGIDSTIERDGEKLRDASEQAIRDLADIQRTALAREEQRKQWLDCKSQLDKMVNDTKPISEIEHKITWWETRVRETQNEIELLKAKLVDAQSNLKSWTQELRHTQQAEKSQRELRAVVDAGEPMLIDDKHINTRFVAVEMARYHESEGEIQRKKHIDRAGAENFTRIADESTDEGKYYRAGAAKIDGILSEQINRLGVDLAVMNGRLYYDTTRGPTLYDELSAGERWRIALDIVIEIAGADSLLSIPQECWEALDPANQMAIAKHCQSRGVALFTAEATDGELRYKMFATE
jgi:energy-coupling factor transporter ATP-binding protein EcfA2